MTVLDVPETADPAPRSIDAAPTPAAPIERPHRLEQLARTSLIPGAQLVLWLFLYLSLLLGGWILLGATIGGWTPVVVTSGSMEPVLSVGDVLLIDGDDTDRIAQRSIIVFERSDGELVAHRVFSVEPDGFVTKGDANPTPDPARVRPSQIEGSGRLVVPLIGLPAVWVAEGNVLAVGAWLVLLGAGLIHLAVLGYRRLRYGRPDRLEPGDMAIAQQGIQRVRLLVAVLIVSQYVLDPSRFDVLDQSGSRLAILVMSIGLLIGTNLVSTRIPPTAISRRTLSAVELGLDTGLVVLLTTLTGTSGVGWVLFALPIIEAAVRFRLVGALTHWMVLTIVTMAARIWTDHLIPAENLLDDLESVLDQLSVLFLVVVPGAYLAEQLVGDVASQQLATGRALDRGRLLERVAEAGREVSRLGGKHLDAIVDGVRQLGFDVVEVLVGDPSGSWHSIGGDEAVLPRPGDDGSGLRRPDLAHEVLLVDRDDVEITEVQSLLDHDLEALLVQTVSNKDGRRVVLRAGLRSGNPATPARVDAFRLLAGQASVALRNDQLLSEITAMHQELRHQAEHDSLTQLPNRVLLLDALTDELDRDSSRTALLFLDLDGFKPVNDRLGHEVGDALLTLVAERLLRAAPNDSLVARVGGDEFTILLRGAGAETDVVTVAESVRSAIRQPFEVGGDIVHIGTSVGIAFGGDGVRERELIRRADVAMYRAKHQDSEVGALVWRPEFDEAEARRARLVSAFPHALFKNELHLAYQPIFAIDGPSEIQGVEALLRWHHPDLGSIPPGEVLEIARAADARDRLHQWITTQACRDGVTWMKLAPDRPLFITVNASPEELGSRNLVGNVRSALAETGLPPDRLFVEISERLVSPDVPEVLENMQGLLAQGVRMLLDDFGEGKTSLSYMHELPIAGIKLDRKLVVNSLRSTTDRIVLGSIVELSHRLGLRVIAEGIETGDHLRAITQAGCSFAQGYHLARPQMASAITAALLGRTIGADAGIAAPVAGPEGH